MVGLIKRGVKVVVDVPRLISDSGFNGEIGRATDARRS
jgi:hypothetical protein